MNRREALFATGALIAAALAAAAVDAPAGAPARESRTDTAKRSTVTRLSA